MIWICWFLSNINLQWARFFDTHISILWCLEDILKNSIVTGHTNGFTTIVVHEQSLKLHKNLSFLCQIGFPEPQNLRFYVLFICYTFCLSYQIVPLVIALVHWSVWWPSLNISETARQNFLLFLDEVKFPLGYRRGIARFLGENR